MQSCFLHLLRVQFISMFSTVKHGYGSFNIRTRMFIFGFHRGFKTKIMSSEEFKGKIYKYGLD